MAVGCGVEYRPDPHGAPALTGCTVEPRVVGVRLLLVDLLEDRVPRMRGEVGVGVSDAVRGVRVVLRREDDLGVAVVAATRTKSDILRKGLAANRLVEWVSRR